MYPEIWFPNLNIEIEHLPEVAFNIFSMPVYFYGIFIASAFLIGLFIAQKNAKRFNKDPEVFADIIIYAIIFAIIGARLYYVIFDFSSYKDNLLSIFNLRQGGLAIYGGIIGAFLASFIYCKVKKVDFFDYADLAMPSVALGQAIGRWGNFFNKEAFGGYTDGLFAMRIRTDVAKYIPSSMEPIFINPGDTYSYIQVQPTFLYESVWNILVFIFLFWFCKKRFFKGEIFFLYFLLYGIGRFIIESFRTDQLLIGNTSIPVSMVVSFAFVSISLIKICYERFIKKEKTAIIK